MLKITQGWRGVCGSVPLWVKVFFSFFNRVSNWSQSTCITWKGARREGIESQENSFLFTDSIPPYYAPAI